MTTHKSEIVSRLDVASLAVVRTGHRRVYNTQNFVDRRRQALADGVAHLLLGAIVTELGGFDR
jgi:hypothetical protein